MKLMWKICWKYRRKWIKKNSHFAIPKIAVNDITIDNINENKDKGFNSIKIKGRHLNLKSSSSSTTDDTNEEL